MLACIKSIFRYFAVLALLTLLGCGGGGGGGSSDAFSVSPTSLTFTATQQEALPASQFVTGTLHISSNIYIEIQLSSSILSADFTPISDTAARLNIRPTTTNLAPGTYNETVRIIGCSDPYCSAGQVAGSPKVVNVVYTVQSKIGLRAAPSSVSFTQIRGSTAPTAHIVTLSDLSGASFNWNASINYSTGSDWLRINGANQASGATLPASFTLSVNPLTAIGNYSAVVRITNSNSTFEIPVSYSLREPQLTAAPVSLSFNAVSNDTLPAVQSLALGAELDMSTNYSVSASYGNGVSGWLTVPNSGIAPNNLSVNVNRTNLNAGTYSATLSITTASRTVSIPVTYTVRAPVVTRTPAQLSFNAFRGGQVPSVQNVIVSTENNINVTYTTSISYGAGASGWLTVPASGVSPGNVSVAINTTNLSVGTYSATVTVRPAYGAAAFTVAVSYQVQEASIIIIPSELRYTITTASVTSDLSKSVSVGDTGVVLSWTATASAAWLALDTTSGTTAGNGSTTTIPVRIVASELNALPSGQYGDIVTFTYSRPDASVVTVRLPVSLTMNLSAVNYVAPYVAISNTSEQIILRGSGFTQATNSVVMIGDNVVSTFNIVSDTEIRVQHPHLAVGNYSVSVTNQLGLTAKRKELVVVDPVKYDYAFIPSTMYPSQVVYDVERKTIYAVRFDPLSQVSRIERNRFIDDMWQTDSLPISNVSDISLSPDGKELIAVGSNLITHIDIASMAVVSVYTGAPNPGGSRFGPIAVANNGIALVSRYGEGIMTYDLMTKRPVTYYRDTYCPQFGVSGDGSRIVIGESCSTDYLMYYDASTGSFFTTDKWMSASMIDMDREGMVTEFWGMVFDDQFNQIGNILFDGRTAISYDGTRGYGFMLGHYYGAPSTVKIYDLNSKDMSGNFMQLGSDISVPDYTGEYNFNLIATPDGQNLILFGNQGLIIQPLP